MLAQEYHQIIKNHLRCAYLLTDERIDELMPRFIATLVSLVHDLEKITIDNNFKDINRIGHTMKGALLNLGLQQLAEKAYGIEKIDPSETEQQLVAQLVDELKKEIEKITL
jgi:HPt (histidine-containing phosphotransfer) domain-containing protein